MKASFDGRIREIYRRSPLVTGCAPNRDDLFRWDLAGSGFIGLDAGDRMAIGVMLEAEQQHNAPLSRTIQHFIEAHCTELPAYWGERGVTMPPSGDSK